MAVSASAVLSPLCTCSSSSKNRTSSSRSFVLFNGSSKPCNPRPSTVVFASRSRNEVLNDKEQEQEQEQLQLLEQYGFDPDELLSPKSRRKLKQQMKGKGNEVTPKASPKAPRSTHELIKVLGGTVRRRKLLSPKGFDVRPMMNVVKGSAFDILQTAGGCPSSLRPGRWLDLYSGTGCVGIEAMSRGCSEAHFVEMDPWLVGNVIQPNLERTGFHNVSVIHTLKVEVFLERAQQLVDASGPFDYISVTPPYTEVDYGVLMGQISNSGLIGEDTFIVVEYPFRTEMVELCGGLEKVTTRRFGRTHLAIYGPKWAQKTRKSQE